MSRAHRIGSIFSRVEALIRKDHLQKEDIPLWFDVYKRFPPKYNPTLKRLEPDINIREIFYKEDVIRSKIHKTFKNQLRVFDLQSNQESVSQKMLKSCMDFMSQGMSEDEAIQKLKETYKEDLEKTYRNKKEESKHDTTIIDDHLKKILEGS